MTTTTVKPSKEDLKQRLDQALEIVKEVSEKLTEEGFSLYFLLGTTPVEVTRHSRSQKVYGFNAKASRTLIEEL